MKRFGLIALFLAMIKGQRAFDALLGLFGAGAVVQGVTSAQPYPGTPGAGTANVQTITINGTPDGGTWRLTYQGVRTASMAYNESLANVQAKLVALPGIGTGGVVVTGTPGASYVVTFQVVGVRGALTVAAADMLLTNAGTATAAPGIVQTTPGVDPTPKGVVEGGLVQDTTNGVLYINTGTVSAPTWTKVGTQS